MHLKHRAQLNTKYDFISAKIETKHFPLNQAPLFLSKCQQGYDVRLRPCIFFVEKVEVEQTPRTFGVIALCTFLVSIIYIQFLSRLVA